MKPFRTLLSTLCLATLAASSTRLMAHSATEEMAQAANNFLAALTPEQKAKATFDVQNEERQNWYFIPKVRNGLTVKDMTHFQRPLAFALLSSGLSHQGLLKAETIMSMEEVLRVMEAPAGKMVRDPELYYVSIFGKPGTNATWGWRVEGHHLSVNFTIVDGKTVSATPSFLGSNPGEVKNGPRQGLRILATEEDLGRQLVKSFDDKQRAVAVLKIAAPAEMITSNQRQVKALETAGLPRSEMKPAQKELLSSVIKEYIYRERSELADIDWAKIEKAGLDKIYFAWAGGLERGEAHYYRVQGPTFLLEYDNTQNNANHIHAVWRDFEHDFGMDLLRDHYDKNPHP